jgi:hypothetical protein
MFVNRFESRNFFSRYLRVVHEIIVKTARGGTLAVASGGGKMLRNPPRFISKLAVEPCNVRLLSAARVGLERKDILAQPSQ